MPEKHVKKAPEAADELSNDFDPMHEFIIKFSLTEGKRINTELQPFLNELKLVPSNKQKKFKDAYEKYRVRSQEAYELQATLNKDHLIDTRETASLREQIHALFSYLGFVESLGNCYVDILVLLLVAVGRDFHIESKYITPRIRHLVSIDDLEKEKIPLTTKLNFLKDNGIMTFPSVIDSRLRNDIAHLNFSVIKGKIYVRKKPSHEILEYNFMKIALAISRVTIQLNELAEELGWVKKQADKKTGDRF